MILQEGLLAFLYQKKNTPLLLQTKTLQLSHFFFCRDILQFRIVLACLVSNDILVKSKNIPHCLVWFSTEIRYSLFKKELLIVAQNRVKWHKNQCHGPKIRFYFEHLNHILSYKCWDYHKSKGESEEHWNCSFIDWAKSIIICFTKRCPLKICSLLKIEIPLHTWLKRS